MTPLACSGSAWSRRLAALVASPLPAAAEDVPAATTFTVTGYGYGHGHGMSQYGAQGAANQGLSWQQIVGFYYPGTAWGAPAASVKVLITADTSKDVMVEARNGLRLHRLPGARPTAGQGPAEGDALADHAAGLEERGLLPAPARRLAEVDDVPGCRRVLGRQAAHAPAARSTRPRSTAARSGRCEKRHGQRAAARPLPAGRRPARGPGAMAARTRCSAQAVAARTLRGVRTGDRDAHYEICDTTSCQVYGGVDAEHPAVQRRGRRRRQAGS